jgi:hypothetical protein
VLAHGWIRSYATASRRELGPIATPAFAESSSPVPARIRSRLSSLTQAGAAMVEADALPGRAALGRPNLISVEVVIASRADSDILEAARSRGGGEGLVRAYNEARYALSSSHLSIGRPPSRDRDLPLTAGACGRMLVRIVGERKRLGVEMSRGGDASNLFTAKPDVHACKQRSLAGYRRSKRRKRSTQPWRTRVLMLKAVARPALGVIVVLALMSTFAQTSHAGSVAPGCSNETVAVFGKTTPLRFVLRSVSCSEAHRTIRAYFREATPARCRRAGNICGLAVSGGWDCALAGAASEAPLIAGCFRGNASVKVYPATPPHKATGLIARWRKAADRAGFAVYRPRQTLGLKLSDLVLTASGCLQASYGNHGSMKGPHFGLYEPANTSQCGQPGDAAEVAPAVINGVNVPVLVQCATLPKCTTKDGETNGVFLLFVPEHAGPHYAIQLQSSHVSLSDFLKVARSFTKVPK